VAWHQDKTVAVSSEVNTTGWTNWSVKGGVSHAQPPSEVFSKMLTIRIHLDAANQTNGCLKVIPKSHSLGALSQADIPKHTAENNTVYCCANPGDALVMHPLLIHASGKATESTARRVLHLEYTSYWGNA
jgi:ectoine hydroxylase-related dioxygenase (phytanoyl-CoA dioxygenase family)